MTNEEILQKIDSVDLSKYSETDHVNSIRKALEMLLNLESSSNAEEVGQEVLSNIGNNHAGTYYPVIVPVLDILILIEKFGEHSAGMCARALLNDLYYFGSEISGNSIFSEAELRDFVKQKLAPYSGPNFSAEKVSN